jgi:hypothetical protein
LTEKENGLLDFQNLESLKVHLIGEVER